MDEKKLEHFGIGRKLWISKEEAKKIWPDVHSLNRIGMTHTGITWEEQLFLNKMAMKRIEDMESNDG